MSDTVRNVVGNLEGIRKLPDFSIKNVNLYNVDCMTFMKDIPDNFYELAIVDPPYGIGVSNAKEIGYKGNNVFTPKNWDNIKPDKAYFSELFRISKQQIIWGGNYFELPPSRCFLVWDKGEGFYNRTYAECEIAWTSFDKNTVKYRRDPLAKRDYHNKIHPTQKPVQLYKWILEKYADVGDKIFDSHGGSFSSACACLDMGFYFDGCEIDQEYFHNAVERLKNNVQEYINF